MLYRLCHPCEGRGPGTYRNLLARRVRWSYNGDMPGSKTYCVYIMASRKNGTLYVGVTGNLVQRVMRHKDGAVPGFTERYGVHRLVYHESFRHIDDAILREKRLKKWKRHWKIRLIERTNPEWRDLYDSLVG